LTYIDHFTRYPEAIPIPNQEAETVARALVTQVFTRHGCPQVLSSDRGTNFMSALFQEMCKLLQIKRINSTSFNPKMQGKIEKFHFGLNQTMSHYVNKYGNDWDDFVDYALMVHRATPHSVTKFSPYYLLYGRDMRLPNMDDLSARVEVPGKEPDSQDKVGSHIQTLAGKLNEAYEVVIKLNKSSRAKQKAYYDRNTKLVTFSVGDYVYLKEMAIGAGKSKKFRTRWRGPYLITKRLSDLNYQIQITPGKLAIVNVNRLKRCHDAPKRKKAKKTTAPPIKENTTDEEWDTSDEEPLYLLGKRKLIPASESLDHSQSLEEVVTDNPTQNDTAERDNNNRPEEVGDNTTDETQDVTEPQNEQTDSVNTEGDRGDQRQPYPYDLRPLPGRRNYNPTDH